MRGHILAGRTATRPSRLRPHRCSRQRLPAEPSRATVHIHSRPAVGSTCPCCWGCHGPRCATMQAARPQQGACPGAAGRCSPPTSGPASAAVGCGQCGTRIASGFKHAQGNPAFWARVTAERVPAVPASSVDSGTSSMVLAGEKMSAANGASASGCLYCAMSAWPRAHCLQCLYLQLLHFLPAVTAANHVVSGVTVDELLAAMQFSMLSAPGHSNCGPHSLAVVLLRAHRRGAGLPLPARFTRADLWDTSTVLRLMMASALRLVPAVQAQAASDGEAISLAQRTCRMAGTPEMVHLGELPPTSQVFVYISTPISCSLELCFVHGHNINLHARFTRASSVECS